MLKQFIMASRSLNVLLRRNGGYFGKDIKSFPCLYAVNASKYCSSGALSSELREGSELSEEDDDLKSKIFRLRLPKRSATNVLQKWVGEGNPITISELRLISKELRKLNRFKHALEISEWMISHDEFEVSDTDYAVRIDLISKVFGIAAAERYFEGLSIAAKTSETYTALLHSYAAAKMTERAEDLYNRIKDSDLTFSAITYNEIMTLYMSVGQLDKVHVVFEDLKKNKVAPDIYTYNLRVSARAAATQNTEAVTMLLDEMKLDSSDNEDCRRYIDLARIYVECGPFVNSWPNSIVESESGIAQRQWITYDFLMILYAAIGDQVKIDQIWKSLMMTGQKMKSTSYLCVLSSYAMLEHWDGAGEVLEEWKQSTATEFDVSECDRLLDAFVEARFIEIATKFLEILIQRSCQPRNMSKYEHLCK